MNSPLDGPNAYQNRNPRSTGYAVAAAIALLGLGSSSSGHAAVSSDVLRAKARGVLERALQQEAGFVQIHAAEALAATGQPALARSAFLDFAAKPATTPPDPARIGKWRVLALTSTTDSEKNGWIERVRRVAADPAAADRLQAVETLAKLHVRLPAEELPALRQWAEASTPALACFPWWLLHLNGATDALPRIIQTLGASDPTARLRAAYVLKRERIPGAGAALTRAWSLEKTDSPAYPYLLCARAVLADNPDERAQCIAQLGAFAADPTRPSGRYEACLTLMTVWPESEAGKLDAALDSPDADTRVGAAWAILHLSGHDR